MNQADLYEYFAEFQIKRNDAVYPPYHKGEYLEEFFVGRFKNSDENSDYLFIPVHWTAVFNYRAKDGLGPGSANQNLRKKLFNKISNLSTEKKYFTVSTHDDAPQGKFPPDTKHFYAGGNSELGTDPIPLICSEIKFDQDPQKLIFCSFVGSATNHIRNQALQSLHSKDGYLINAFHWKPDVSQDQQDLFINCTSRSRFTLCPRGYGATSYRLYESMKLGSIPVYISDKHMLPWSDVLDWNTFCVIVKNSNEYDTLDEHLKNLTESQVRSMQDKLKEIYHLYFTITAVYNQIITRIK